MLLLEKERRNGQHKMGRGPTAYFIFTDEQRPHAREKLLAERGGDKVSVADVAKEMGTMWRQLSDEEKQKYKDAAAAAATTSPSSKVSAKREQPAMLPLSLVKRIICRDEEVKRVSGDAVRVIAEATGMFIGLLATKSLEYAKAQKRKNFKFSDIEAAARADSRMKEIGLPLSFDHEDVFVEMKKRRVDGSGGGGGGRKKKEVGGGAAQGKTLHSFFAPRAAHAEREEGVVVIGEEEQENEDGDIEGDQGEVLEEDQQQQQQEEEEEEEEKGEEQDAGNT